MISSPHLVGDLQYPDFELRLTYFGRTSETSIFLSKKRECFG